MRAGERWMFRTACAAVLAVCMIAPAQSLGTITLGQVDDYQDGTTQSWNGAAGFFNTVTGGQGGAGDFYLEVVASAPAGQGSRVATFNANQWAGDYIAAGVTAIQVDMANFGATQLEMRSLLLFGAGGDFTSTLTTSVPADGVWRTYVFGLANSDMTQVSGIGTLNDTLATVGRLLFRHESGPPSGIGGGTVVAGTLGFDNILAIPEPATLSLLALGSVALLRRRR